MFIIKNIDVLIFQSPTGPNIDLSGVSAFNNAFNKTNVRLYSKPRGYFYLQLFIFFCEILWLQYFFELRTLSLKTYRVTIVKM